MSEYDPPVISSNSNSQLLIGLLAGAVSLSIGVVVIIAAASGGNDVISNEQPGAPGKPRSADTSDWTAAQRDAWSKFVSSTDPSDRDDVHVLTLRGTGYPYWLIRSRTIFEPNRTLDIPDGPNYLTGWHRGPAFAFGFTRDNADKSAAMATSEPWSRAVVGVRLYRNPPEVVTWYSGQSRENEKSLNEFFGRIAHRVGN